MGDYSYELMTGRPRATLGLVVLKSDETIEQDFRRLWSEPDDAVYVSRVQSAAEVSRDTLMQMRDHIRGSAALFPDSIEFDVVGYGCTSGTAVIGPDTIAELVRAGCRTRAVTEPLSALVAHCRARDVTRLAFLSPYVASVSSHLRDALAARGVQTPVFGSFNEAEEAKVTRIAPASMIAAATDLAASGEVDAVFLSCTNLRTLDVIPKIEQAIGKPVFSSNQVLSWHMAQLAGAG